MASETLKNYQRKFEQDSLSNDDVEAILLAWEDETDELAVVEWGNCRRGCPPAYLDRKGFCSPACAMGAPRGEFVTLKAG